ncbi:MAG: glycosyltransferase, partial [Bacteroidaceae bacterium]|nr:glycosyltransferase [Bacteroidaceae bacterium]
MTIVSFLQIHKRKKYYSAEYIKRILLNSPHTPGISIVAPAYNEETTVVDNVNSLLGMDYPKFEVIIGNDGSKDKTLEKLIENFDLVEVPYNYIEY